MLETSPEMYFKVFSKLETGTFPSLEAVAEVVERASRFFVRSNFSLGRFFTSTIFVLVTILRGMRLSFGKQGREGGGS